MTSTTDIVGGRMAAEIASDAFRPGFYREAGIWGKKAATWAEASNLIYWENIGQTWLLNYGLDGLLYSGANGGLIATDYLIDSDLAATWAGLPHNFEY